MDIQTIASLSNPAVSLYLLRNENQLYHYFEPDLGVFIAESKKVVSRALDEGYEPLSLLFEDDKEESLGEDFLRRFLDFGVPVYVASRELMSEIAGYKLTGGVLSAMRRRALISLEEILTDDIHSVSAKNADTNSAASERRAIFAENAPLPKNRIAVLEDIENPTNVGAIFRSAAALSVGAVLLTKNCADPLYRRAARVSMGTVFQVPWTVVSGATAPIDALHRHGYKVAAMALTDESVSIASPELKSGEKLALIFGNEDSGLSEATLEKSDYIVKIPMAGGVDSLNVAASSAVAFWETRKEIR